MSGKCPWCRTHISPKRIIGNSYYCTCGWSFRGVFDDNGGLTDFVGSLIIVIMIAFGVKVFSQSEFTQDQNHFPERHMASQVLETANVKIFTSLHVLKSNQ